MALKDWQNTIGNAASFVSIFHLLIPAGICYQIIRQGNTENINPAHFIIGTCMTLMKMRHGQMLNAYHMIQSTAVGFTLSMVYLSVYIYYTDNRRAVRQLMVKIASAPLVMMIYSFLDEPTRAEKVYGVFCSLFLFVLITIPLFRLKQVIKQKHTGDLSLAMALYGTIQCTLWLLYSLTLGSYIEMVSRAVLIVMIIPQLVMFMLYPMPPTKKSAESSKKKA